MIVTRFAPSPTGRLHLGHAFSATLGHSRARESGGKFLLRIEDLDQGRSRPEFVDGIFEDLQWLGLGWNEPVLVQSQRTDVYADALDRLRERGLVYACFCTRADIAQSLTAPHGDAATSYPGTCRGLPDDPERRATTPHCWRLDSAKALDLVGLPSWTEADGSAIRGRRDPDRRRHPRAEGRSGKLSPRLRGRRCGRAASRWSSAAPTSAHRRPSSACCSSLLGLPEPTYLHHPLVTHEDGRRLAKRDLAPTLAAMREAGVDGAELAAALAKGQLPLGFAFSEA